MNGGVTTPLAFSSIPISFRLQLQLSNHLRRLLDHRLGSGLRSRFHSRDIDAAFKVSSIFDHDAGGLDVSYQAGFLAEDNLFGSLHVALYGSVHHNFPRLHRCADFSVRAYGETVLQLDRALHLTINVQFLAAVNFSLHSHRRPNHSAASRRFRLLWHHGRSRGRGRSYGRLSR